MASWLIRLQWKSHQSSPKTSWNILVCMVLALEASGKLGPRNPFFGSPKSKIYFFALMSDSYELHLIRSQISYWSHCCQMRSKSRYLKPGSPKYTFLGFFILAEISLFRHFSGFSFFPFWRLSSTEITFNHRNTHQSTAQCKYFMMSPKTLIFLFRIAESLLMMIWAQFFPHLSPRVQKLF